MCRVKDKHCYHDEQHNSLHGLSSCKNPFSLTRLLFARRSKIDEFHHLMHPSPMLWTFHYLNCFSDKGFSEWASTSHWKFYSNLMTCGEILKIFTFTPMSYSIKPGPWQVACNVSLSTWSCRMQITSYQKPDSSKHFLRGIHHVQESIFILFFPVDFR